MRIAIVNGPNLNLLGKREPEIYGDSSFGYYYELLQKQYENVDFQYFQYNEEGLIVSKLQELDAEVDCIVLNAASLTHTSIAIADVVKAIKTPVVEVHISNVYQRAYYRHHSYISPNAEGVIAGFGLKGYDLAVDYALKL